MATGDSTMSIFGHTGKQALIYMSILLVVTMLIRIALNAYNTRLENITYARMNFIIRGRLMKISSRRNGKARRKCILETL